MAVCFSRGPKKQKERKKTESRVEKVVADVKAKAKSFKRVETMSPENKEALHHMFSIGKTVPEICRTLRDMGLFLDIAEGSLRQYMYRYKWEVVDKQVLVAAEMIKPSSRGAKVVKQVRDQFDVIEEVAELVEVQKERVHKLLGREKDMPMLFNTLGGEMKTLAGFIQQYADLSFELGTLKKAPQVTTISKEGGVTTVESPGRSQVMFSMENVKQVEDAAQVFFDALEDDGDDYEREVQSL